MTVEKADNVYTRGASTVTVEKAENVTAYDTSTIFLIDGNKTESNATYGAKVIKGPKLDTQLSSAKQDNSDLINKVLAKINEETNPAKREVLIEAASIGLGIPADELRNRAKEFTGTASIRRKISNALNVLSSYSTYPGVTINSITNSIIKHLREDGVTEEEFPDSSVKEMVSEMTLSRQNDRPDVGKNEQKFLEKIAKEVTDTNPVMAVVVKHRKAYRKNYKAELPWQYVADLANGIDPFTKKTKKSKTAKRKGLDDATKALLESIPTEERSDVEQARFTNLIWDQFLKDNNNNELEAARAVNSSFQYITDPATRIAVIRKALAVAKLYGDLSLTKNLTNALVLQGSSYGRGLRQMTGTEGLEESILDEFFKDMDARTMAVLEEEINGKNVEEIIREIVGLASIVPKTREEIAKMIKDLVKSLSGGLSSAMANRLFFTINDLLTPAEKALSKDQRQEVIRTKLIAAARSYHYRAGKNVAEKTGYDKIIDAYVRKTLGGKINRPYDIREALKPFINELNGPNWLNTITDAVRDAGTLLQGTATTPNDRALASAYAEHVIAQILTDDAAFLNTAIDNIDPALEVAIVDALAQMKTATLLTANVTAHLLATVPGISLYKARLVANYMKDNFSVLLTPQEKAAIRRKINDIVGKPNKKLAEDIFRLFASGDIDEMSLLQSFATHLGVMSLNTPERIEYGKLLQDVMTSRNAKDLAKAYKNLSMFTDSLASTHGVDGAKAFNDLLDRIIGHGYNSMLSGWQTWQRAGISGILEEMFNVILDLFSGVITGNTYLTRIAMRGVQEMLVGGGLNSAERITYAADALHKIVIKNDPVEYKFHRDWNINSNSLEIKRQKLKDNWKEVFKYVFGFVKGNFKSPAELINAMKTTRIPFGPKDVSANKTGQAFVTAFDMLMYPFLKPLVLGVRMITWVDAVYTSMFADYENTIHELQRDIGTGPLSNLIAARGLHQQQLKAEIAAEVRAEGLTGTAAIRRKQELWLGMMETEAFKRTMHNLEVASMATYAQGLPGVASAYIDKLSKGDDAGSKMMKMITMILSPFTKVLGGSISRMYKATPLIGIILEKAPGIFTGRSGNIFDRVPSQVLDYNPETGKHEWRDNTRLEAIRGYSRFVASAATLLGLMMYLFDFEEDEENSVVRIVPNKEAMFRITGPGTTSYANDKNVDKDYNKNSIQVKTKNGWATVIDYSIVPSLAPVSSFLGMLYDRHALVSDKINKGYIVQRLKYENGSIVDSRYDVDISDLSAKLMYAMTHIMFESSVSQSARHVTDMFELVTEKSGTKTELDNETEVSRVQSTAARVWGNIVSQYTKPSLYKQMLGLYRTEHQVPLPDYPTGSIMKRMIEKNMRDIAGMNILANSIYGEGRALKDVFGVPIIPEQDFFVIGGTGHKFELPDDWVQRPYGEYLARKKELDPVYDFIHSRTDINDFGRYYPKADIEGGIETIPSDIIDEMSDIAAIRMGYYLMDSEQLEELKAMPSAEVEDYINKKLKKKVGDEAKAIVFQKYLNAIDPSFLDYNESMPLKFDTIKSELSSIGLDVLTDEEVEAGKTAGMHFLPDGTALVSKKTQAYLKEKHPALYQWFVEERKTLQDAIPFVSDMDLLDWGTFSDDDKERRKMMYEKYQQINNH